ncbi:nucleotidyltransferase domain-containing protein [Promicromonospora sp. NPDC052451]|uniref:nucleotidyltransferase domain-containing protein n=1 Tax=Promicromonospora sp. NPDC052451 TaxID=3364407 RepID=UPI0037C67EF6
MPLPDVHERFLDGLLPRVRSDSRIVGVAAGGSVANGVPDEYSDVDLVLAVEDDAFDQVMRERLALIEAWSPLVAGFTGEHVGEPRLIITLMGPEALHVDFKFVRYTDFTSRVDELQVLWERDGRLSTALAATSPSPPRLDLQWIDDRFWVWIHYGATKLARGELFEAIGFISYLRETVFGPLIQYRHGKLLQGVRRLETTDPDAARALEATVCGRDTGEIGRALLACVDLYDQWTDGIDIAFHRNDAAARLATQYLDQVVGRLGSGPASDSRAAG